MIKIVDKNTGNGYDVNISAGYGRFAARLARIEQTISL